MAVESVNILPSQISPTEEAPTITDEGKTFLSHSLLTDTIWRHFLQNKFEPAEIEIYKRKLFL